MTTINGKVLRIETLADLPRINEVDVSAVILDSAVIPEFSAMRDFMAEGLRENPKKLRNSIHGTLRSIFFPPAEFRSFRRKAAEIFRSISKNNTIRESWNFSDYPGLSEIRHDPSYWGRFPTFRVLIANMGTQDDTGAAGIQFLKTPIDQQRYAQSCLLQSWQDAAKKNPDLEWDELKPGEVMIYKGGNITPQNSILIYTAPQGPQTIFSMSDSEIPLPPAH